MLVHFQRILDRSRRGLGRCTLSMKVNDSLSSVHVSPNLVQSDPPVKNLFTDSRLNRQHIYHRETPLFSPKVF